MPFLPAVECHLEDRSLDLTKTLHNPETFGDYILKFK